ncbi:hypothetical protein [Clostridium sp.]
MKCPKCGQEAVGNFCSNCGTPLVNDTVRREPENVAGRKTEDGQNDGGPVQQNRQSQGAQKREEERRDNERRQSQAQEDARRDREAASRRRQDARRSSSSAKEDKRDAKQQKRMEKRLHALESERERSERQKDRMERSHQRELERQSREAERTRRAAERSEAHAQSDSNDGPSMLDVTAAGVTGVVVLMARVMQAASFLLMAGITWANAKAFRYGGDDLGYIGTMITEENHGLGLYVGIGVFLVLMGVIWCLWILSGKHAGGKVRLQKYDTGRGFIPFIIVLVLVLAAGPAAYLMPKNAGSLQPIVDGGYAALEAINANHGFLLFCSIGGAILSFIRKMLLV